MPRPVVPMFCFRSLATSSCLCSGSTRCARSDTRSRPLAIALRLREVVQLDEQLFGVEHDAVADDAGGAGMEDARRDLVQDVEVAADDDGVTRVGAALVAHHEVGALREHVDQLALPLIAPLRAHYDDTSGAGVEHGISPYGNKKAPRGAAESFGGS